MATGFTIDLEKLAQLDPTVLAQLEKVSPGLFKKGLALTTVPECTPLSEADTVHSWQEVEAGKVAPCAGDAMSSCSTADFGATEVSEDAPTEFSKDAPT